MSIRHGRMSAHALAAAYATGDADPVVVAKRGLAIAAATPHCFVTLTPERAEAEAAASRDRWRAGAPLGPLDGVPIAWKDMFEVAGTPTTMGSAIHRGDPPAARDAAVVATAASAGMVTLGKTNLTEFAFSVLGLNPHFGTPVVDGGGGTIRVPGGSSSGSAVAVAAGATPYGIATDTAGSARVPAAFNGIVGYRASSTRYPKDGLRPLSKTLDTFGIIANDVGDLVLLDAVLTGGATPARPPTRPSLVVDPGILADARVPSCVRSDIEGAIDRLRAAGIDIAYRRIAAVHKVFDLTDRHGWLGAAEAFALHRALLESPDAARMDGRVRTRLLAGAAIGDAGVAALRRARAWLMASVAEELRDAILVTPTVSHPPPVLRDMEDDQHLFAEVNLASLRLTAPGSFLDLPSLSLPVGSGDDGQWTGLQLSLPTSCDDRLLHCAGIIEAALADQ